MSLGTSPFGAQNSSVIAETFANSLGSGQGKATDLGQKWVSVAVQTARRNGLVKLEVKLKLDHLTVLHGERTTVWRR